MRDKAKQKRLADKKRRKAKKRIEVLKARALKPKTVKKPKPEERKIDEDVFILEEKLKLSTFNWPERMLMDIGQSIHAGRKVSPIDVADAPEGATYDDRVGITYAPIDIETCGYRITSNPRRVGVREVAKLANKSCSSCNGIGFWKTTRTQSAGNDEFGVKIMQDLEYEQTCACAEEVYKREFENKLVVDSQLGEWIALEDLVFEKKLDIKVEGLIGQENADVPTVHETEPVNESSGAESVPELSGTGT